MPKPGCRDCKKALAAFACDDEGGGSDPLEWAENHLWFHDRRRKAYRKTARAGKENHGK